MGRGKDNLKVMEMPAGLLVGPPKGKGGWNKNRQEQGNSWSGGGWGGSSSSDNWGGSSWWSR